jgi:hypothetical protein
LQNAVAIDKLGEAIGQAGQFGSARVCTHLPTGEQRAVKIIPKARFAGSKFHYDQLRGEISTMQSMDHPNIIK